MLVIIDTVGTSINKAADVFGVTANLSASYKYGQTANDKISLRSFIHKLVMIMVLVTVQLQV